MNKWWPLRQLSAPVRQSSGNGTMDPQAQQLYNSAETCMKEVFQEDPDFVNWVEAWMPAKSTFSERNTATERVRGPRLLLPGPLSGGNLTTDTTKTNFARGKQRRAISVKDLLRKVVTLCEQGFLSTLEKKLVNDLVIRGDVGVKDALCLFDQDGGASLSTYLSRRTVSAAPSLPLSSASCQLSTAPKLSPAMIKPSAGSNFPSDLSQRTSIASAPLPLPTATSSAKRRRAESEDSQNAAAPAAKTSALEPRQDTTSYADASTRISMPVPTATTTAAAAASVTTVTTVAAATTASTTIAATATSTAITATTSPAAATAAYTTATATTAAATNTTDTTNTAGTTDTTAAAPATTGTTGTTAAAPASSTKEKSISIEDRYARRRPRHWNQNEDKRLEWAVRQYGERNWKQIATYIPTRTHVQCLQRWKKALDPRLVKGQWTDAEDMLLRKLVKNYGFNWKKIAEHVTGRNTKQCRERWCNYLDPHIKKGKWTPREDALIFEQQKLLGNKWSRIAKMLVGRTDNQVKIRYNSLMRRKQARAQNNLYLKHLRKQFSS